MPTIKKSFKIESFSTASAFDPAVIDKAKCTTKTIEKVTSKPDGAYSVYYNPESGEYFYSTE